MEDIDDIKYKWQKRTLSEQMGNIGSEVGRALKWKDINEIRKTSALERALELFDFTVEDKRWNGGRLKEICRSREVVNDFFYGNNDINSNADSLEKYFNYFAISARTNLIN